MSSVRFLVVFAVACGSHETPCERVAETARAIHPGAYRGTLRHCATNDWPESRRACAVAATTRTEFTACSGAHLVVDLPLPDLPVADANAHPELRIELRVDGTLHVDKRAVTPVELDSLLAAAIQRDPDTRIVFAAPSEMPVQPINEIVRRVNAAGFKHLDFEVIR